MSELNEKALAKAIRAVHSEQAYVISEGVAVAIRAYLTALSEAGYVVVSPVPRITWGERVRALTTRLGRKPSLSELLELSKSHTMTPEEIEAQKQSWVRAFTTPCEHGELDFEQCPKCRNPTP